MVLKTGAALVRGAHPTQLKIICSALGSIAVLVRGAHPTQLKIICSAVGSALRTNIRMENHVFGSG